MRSALIPIVIAIALAGCAGGGSSPTTNPKAEEVPLTKEEMIATHTNTILSYKMSNGGYGNNTFGSDGTVKGTYYNTNGSADSDEGTITFENNIACLKWKKWTSGKSECWADYKIGDNQYVCHEQGGKKRSCTWSVKSRI